MLDSNTEAAAIASCLQQEQQDRVVLDRLGGPRILSTAALRRLNDRANELELNAALLDEFLDQVACDALHTCMPVIVHRHGGHCKSGRGRIPAHLRTVLILEMADGGRPDEGLLDMEFSDFLLLDGPGEVA